ncbi:MAG: hypothetical protein E7390_09150, partial [Ruminococcaceae bacterium]|nr:hypothetical protein [Oscillospiraceae bacterium]
WKNDEGQISNEIIDITAKKGKWERHEHTFTAPEGATILNLYPRSRKNSGDVVYDNVVLNGKITEEKGPDAPEAVVYDTKVATGKTGELAMNGGFEKLDAEGLPSGWKNSTAAHCRITNDAHSGNNAVILDSTGGKERDYISLLNQRMNFVAGAKYKFSIFTKDASEGMVLCFKVEFTGEDALHIFVSDLGTKEWKETTLEFTAPLSGSFVTFVRTQKVEGKVTVDDYSITGEIYELPIEFKEPYDETCTELLENTSFETPNAAGNGAKGWTPYGLGEEADWSASSDYVTWTNERAHTGEYSVKIDNTAGKKDWIRFQVKDGMLPGAYYQLSFWAYCESEIADGVGFKFEWEVGDALDGEEPAGNSFGNGLGNTGGEWKRFSTTSLSPDTVVGVMAYIRLYVPGIAYIDDASLYRVSPSSAKPATISTNNIFFETGYEGDVEISIKKAPLIIETNNIPMDGATVTYSFRDGDTVLAQSEPIPFVEDKMSYGFPASLIAEKEKEYRIVATLTDGAGKTYEFSQRVYKFDRPTAIREDGLYIDENGEVFDPAFAYHVGELRNVPNRVNYLDDAIAMGMNVMQITAVRNTGKVIEQLDTLEERGVKALVSLYPNMESAGNPKNIEYVKETVKAVKDHPAVFAWAVMDEPNQQLLAPEGMNQAENRDNELIDAYLTIRAIDKVKPVYICECKGLEDSSRYCDVFLNDAYKKSYGQNTKMINKQYNFARPVYSLLPAYSQRDNIDTYRFDMYDGFFEGSLSTGIYAMEYFYDENFPNLAPMREELITMNQTGELADAYAYFVHNKYQTLSEKVAADEAYAVYVKDSKVYAVVANRKAEAAEITVLLVSADGKTVVADASVKGLYGASESYRAANGAVSIKLEAERAAVYEITPDAAVDFSGLRLRSRFRDLNEITWAKDSIEKLDSLGIVNDGGNPRIFSPQTKITRGEFAMFLVRTLGLTGDATENFSDVDPNAEYAKEIAIGRAAGILNGIGENLYNPEAEITRQDMMTIISRGMNLAGEADMTVFSDSGLVADYALAHVKAMISSGLIKGNADGTLNPTGNTTRAEAAVIMDRIYSQTV